MKEVWVGRCSEPAAERGCPCPRDAGAGGVREALGHRQRRLRPPGGLRAVPQAAVVGRHPGALRRAQGAVQLPGGSAPAQLPVGAAGPAGCHHLHAVRPRVRQHARNNF